MLPHSISSRNTIKLIKLNSNHFNSLTLAIEKAYKILYYILYFTLQLVSKANSDVTIKFFSDHLLGSPIRYNAYCKLHCNWFKGKCIWVSIIVSKLGNKMIWIAPWLPLCASVKVHAWTWREWISTDNEWQGSSRTKSHKSSCIHYS